MLGSFGQLGTRAPKNPYIPVHIHTHMSMASESNLSRRYRMENSFYDSLSETANELLLCAIVSTLLRNSSKHSAMVAVAVAALAPSTAPLAPAVTVLKRKASTAGPLRECASVHIKCTHDLFWFLSSKAFHFQERTEL